MWTMPQEQLHEALAALHEELTSAQELSERERAALVTAIEEIKDALARGADRDRPGSVEESLSGRVTTLIDEFEASHPRFAEILRNLSESLANIGI